MAERPRLKKTDEILGSLPVEAARVKRTGANGTSAEFSFDPKDNPANTPRPRRARKTEPREEEAQPAATQTVEIAPAPVSAENTEYVEIAEGPVLPSAQTLAEKLMAHDDKRKKLNFSKYELPKRTAPQTAVAVFDEEIPPAPPPKTTAEFEIPKSAAPAAPVSPPPAPKPKAEPKPEPKPEPPPVPQAQPAPPQEPVKVQEYTFPTFEPPPKPEIKPDPVPSPVKPAQPEPVQPEPAAVDPSREEFLKRIANQFEIQFEEKFEQNTRAGAARPQSARAAREQPSPFGDITARHAPEPEDDSPASDFLSKFTRDVQREEQRQQEDFKETLAQKFERERERYLKELNIAPQPVEDDEPPGPEQVQAAQPPGQRRKLDFQIQPEMHISQAESGDKQPHPQSHAPRTGASPPQVVTYTRQGVSRPQVHTDGEITGISLSGLNTPPPPVSRQMPQPQAQGRRKSAEQLILEHTTPKPAAQPVPAKFNFTFSTPEEDAKATKAKRPRKRLLPENKVTRRIVMAAAACGLVAVGLVAWPVLRYLQLPGGLLSPSPDNAASPEANPGTTARETLTVYNDMSYTTPASAENVIFKNANVTLKNVDVSDYVMIEGIAGTGKIRLEDVNVDAAISLKDGGVNALELHNVRAERLIIDNPSAETQILASGGTDIAVLELRTPAAVTGESAALSSGVRGLVITPAESGGSINAKLSGLNLMTLDASSRETVLTFENNTRAENMTVEGSLSLSGAGRVVNMSIGAAAQQGAGDIADAPKVTLLVKDVAVTNLNVKSSANLNLTTAVDSVTTSSAVFVGGEGNIAAFTVNPPTGSGARLLIDIAGLNIQNFFSNAASRVNVTGSARINTLTADASTYALGNKVNTLRVRADGVIYENEPDRIDVGEGVRPPESKAENPNLDYDLGPLSPAAVATSGDFATTCGHTRESGGYLLGSGSASDPYAVTTAAQLAHVAAHPESYYIQTADIDISDDSQFTGGFAMIGSANNPFTGMYDGQGYMIQNLRISSDAENVGLFAVNKGQVHNVRLVSGEIESTSPNPSFVGAIAGLNTEGGTVRACSNGANVTGGGNSYTGGLVGYNYGGKVHDSFNYAKISGVTTVGGLVGMNREESTLAGCYNAGSVFGNDIIGAVAGANENATVANCYYLESTCDFGIGEGSGTAVERTSPEMQEPQMAADLAAGNENSLWTNGEDDLSGYRYPVLQRPPNVIVNE